MGAVRVILSGTRDELAGVDLAIANVYARAEKPGGLSGLLILPDGERLIAVDDELELGEHKFKLLDIVEHRTGAFNFHFEELIKTAPPAPPSSKSWPLPAIAPANLAKHLRRISPDILGVLGARVEISAWNETSRDSYVTEWNGTRIGPTTHLKAVAEFAGNVPDKTEVTIGYDLIRYSPDEIYRQEISAFWRVGEAHVHIFARSEGLADVSELWAGDLPEAVLALIAGGADRQK